MLAVIRAEHPSSHRTSTMSDLAIRCVIACFALLQENNCRRYILNLNLLSSTC